jgi:hypothetical protein
MANVYGIDTNKPFNARDVRDAMVRCFKQAHREVLEQTTEGDLNLSEEEKEKLKQLEVEILVRKFFESNQGNFDNPTKEYLLMVCRDLKEFSAHFKNPKIVDRHYREMMRLIEKLPK